jgi:serine protease Do
MKGLFDMVAFLVLVAAAVTACASLDLYEDKPAPIDYEQQAQSVVLLEAGGGWGTGFSVSQGRIVSAGHVCSRSSTFAVETKDGERGRAAVIWYQDGLGVDTCILSTNLDIPPVELSTGRPAIGEMLHSIGNPSYMRWTVQWGRVSKYMQLGGPGAEVIQVDMSVVGGLSGGPVWNEDGEVTAMVIATAIHRSGPFASPIPWGFLVPVEQIRRAIANARS